MMPFYFERPGPPPGVDLVTQAELDAAVAGTVPVYNVTAYGATGDGTTDDTAAIQDALDAVPVGGGIVHFPAGIYLVPSGGLTCDAPVTISVAGVARPRCLLREHVRDPPDRRRRAALHRFRLGPGRPVRVHRLLERTSGRRWLLLHR